MGAFRILSLDGGGTWALLEVLALQALYSENTTGHQILKDFDLVAANSGGSITLAGLVENLTLKDLLANYFLDPAKRKAIYTPISLGENLEYAVYKAIGLAPRYQTAAKLAALQSSLPRTGKLDISALPAFVTASAGRSPHFVITAFNYDTRRALYFRSNAKSAAASGTPPVKATLAEAANASSTAPVLFFDAPAKIGDLALWDGGVAGLNNPVLAATVEALAAGIDAADIRVLSLGSGSVHRPVASPNDPAPSALFEPRQDSSSVKNNVMVFAGAIVDDPPDAATFITHVALGGPLPLAHAGPVAGNVVRLSPMIQPVFAGEAWTVPPGLSMDEFSQLAGTEMDAVDDAQVSLIRKFGVQWIADKVPNQAIRANSQTFACEVGHPSFSLGSSAWKDLTVASPRIA